MSAKPVTTYLTEDGRLVPTIELLASSTNSVPTSGFGPAVQLTVELPDGSSTYVWVKREVATQLALLTGKPSARFSFIPPTMGVPLELREVILPGGEMAPCFTNQADVVLPG